MKYLNNNSGYSIVISLLMVGFLIVVTSGVFNLVLGELNDNRGRENYLKAFAGAEGTLELALLQIKKHGYGYYDDDAHMIDSPLLAIDPTDVKRGRDAIISYDLNSQTTAYTGSINPLGYEIIPMFYIKDDEKPAGIIDIKISPIGGSTLDNLVWNLLGEAGGISGKGIFDKNTSGKFKTLSGREFTVGDKTIGSFLVDSKSHKQVSYMILFNVHPTSSIEYNIHSLEKFTKPQTTITSSAKVGKYRQNLDTTLDNTQFLNILKYSIYSN